MKHIAMLAWLVAAAGQAHAQTADPDARAAAVERQMTEEERFSLVWGYMPVASRRGPAPTPAYVKPAAGYYPPIPRLDFPGIYETDASLGVTNPKMSRIGDVATALPSGLALAASFDPDLARRTGAMIGGEARAKGFNVLLAGGVNLTRDWFGGRNFEYLGEDPLLAGVLAGESIRGIQSQRVVSTAKHLVLNAQETLRHSIDARIAEAELRESDLLAFEIALERGRPGAIMCAYNKINAAHSCANDWLLNRVLRGDWGFKGYVMSDWGATHGPTDMAAGLDQQSGAQLDSQVWFDKPLRAALGKTVPREALPTSVRRILRSLYAVGADAPLAETPIDYAANARVAREAAGAGIVLLKNDGVLPLATTAKTILIVGRYANRGIWSGGGSSQVTPVGGPLVRLPFGGSPFLEVSGYQVLMPSSPLDALRAQLPGATIEFDPGYSPELAAARAAHADLVLVFANQWQVESIDNPSLALPDGQDRLIELVAAANPNAVVVLETGNPVAMPWLGKVRAVVEAWYSGQEGGAAIADVLTGRVNPSGRLPITFPATAAQAPRARPEGLGLPDDGTHQFGVDYVEGADVGYRWYAGQSRKPLFAFGHGLSYTQFRHSQPAVDGRRLSARVTVTNTGARAGADVVQLYLTRRNGQVLRRLAGFARVELQPGETRAVTMAIDPRLLSRWSGTGWALDAGNYAFAIGRSAEDLGATTTVRLAARTIAP
ncbi:glycosyl hydrolase [Sphingomonas ginsenosidivorax]|uniref:Glycosyl hydrolase n=1 Tax=Sphingomonas ginsenosidivorax TaxID=862135 RepID=A0A5C6UEB9_9SPHN|nr:glycoside hydrolase family 3 C-terminal domain-containing protein [Sphingomonas ginsenosidivorax]TXC71092.1 glycosyl hydrolase [Sphingomonas ginsenosidivorax]